ncbi:MAG: M20/M25/M40 family metallo-hydrolase [Proteobacteria bacterium]|nr:M20/M25/M40 family metallo-hydrolase [Pseudomonadota bacterium]
MTVIACLCLAGPATSQDQYLVNWDTVGEESKGHLVNLIRIDSSNPPGNETEVADYLKDVLKQEGISASLYALEPDRANLVARIRGNGTKRPILIMGHTDVVGVQRDNWSEDPFSGIRKNGYIYGRGSLDDKDNVAAGLMVMLLLKRFQVELDRDVIFLAESGEEGTPQVGINFMVEHHWDVIDAEYCLAEGAQNTIVNGKTRSVGIQTTEKLPRRATLIARGTPGHGSRPVADNAVAILAQAIARAAAWQTDVRLNDTTRAYFQRLADISTAEDAFRYRNVENPELSAAIQQHFLTTLPYHYSILRTSVVPTVISAGFRKNVIPSEASAILDIRMLPDEDVAGFYAKLAAVIDDPRITIVPEDIYRPAASPSSIDNEMFRALEAVAARVYPGATVLPKMSTGATDMAQVRAMGMQAYGIGSSRTLEEMNSGRGTHGDDERILEEAFVDLVRFLWLTVIEIAASD